ncbi:hypothetical protein [Rhodococcoides kroppenstedtii]|uniref:hypothetical protein n=1 Tax=Rhodococcoides kroppenstedtii TaxID=293050 RepID=UPI001427DCDD|nr:hypothetical protein [Rhodococcus kroppenstedtii]
MPDGRPPRPAEAATLHIAMIGTTAPSHIYPSLALIAELVRRGHRVTYAVGESLASLVEPTGARVVPFESLLPAGRGVLAGRSGCGDARVPR